MASRASILKKTSENWWESESGAAVRALDRERQKFLGAFFQIRTAGLLRSLAPVGARSGLDQAVQNRHEARLLEIHHG